MAFSGNGPPGAGGNGPAPGAGGNGGAPGDNTNGGNTNTSTSIALFSSIIIPSLFKAVFAI
uniref:Uncharacterized protein n=1 Tax=Oryza meridionalis TaxID=40149 RepID=A0A0E0C1T4_9ORYZ